MDDIIGISLHLYTRSFLRLSVVPQRCAQSEYARRSFRGSGLLMDSPLYPWRLSLICRLVGEALVAVFFRCSCLSGAATGLSAGWAPRCPGSCGSGSVLYSRGHLGLTVGRLVGRQG